MQICPSDDAVVRPPSRPLKPRHPFFFLFFAPSKFPTPPKLSGITKGGSRTAPTKKQKQSRKIGTEKWGLAPAFFFLRFCFQVPVPHFSVRKQSGKNRGQVQVFSGTVRHQEIHHSRPIQHPLSAKLKTVYQSPFFPCTFFRRTTRLFGRLRDLSNTPPKNFHGTHHLALKPRDLNFPGSPRAVREPPLQKSPPKIYHAIQKKTSHQFF